MIADLNRLFQKQRENRWSVSQTDVSTRREKLLRVKAAIIAQRERIAAAIYEDFRKAPMEVELTEIHGAIDELNFTIKHLARWMKPVRVKTPGVLLGCVSEIRYEPKGVVLIFAPWNYPFSLLINPLIAAIAAGNCAIVKPSEKTPALARFFESFVRGLFDESEIAVVQGAGDVGDALLQLPFDHIFFTGSTRIGRRVMEAAARHLTPVTLELGGKSPAIVDASADIAGAAEKIAWGKFVNAGQTCIAPDYVFVHASLKQPFLDAIKASIQTLYGESEEDRRDCADFCRLIDAGSLARIRDLVDRSVAAGARLEIGGRVDPSSRYIAPTVLSDVRTEHPIMGEEIFGPVLPVIAFSDWKEVFGWIQRGSKPLALYLFSRDRSKIEEVLRKTSAGGTTINQSLLHYANPNLPFGGVGESGLGSYHGYFGFKAFSHERAVLRQRGPNLARFFYPPYGRLWQKRVWNFLKRME